MKDAVTLQANGYRIVFHFRPVASSPRHLDLVTTLALDPMIGNFTISSVPTFITRDDLGRLATYFEQHLTHLRHDPASESDTFVPLELGFQVTAFCGEVVDGDEGGFSLDFKINVGSHAQGTRVYVGAEADVDVRQIRRFIADLRAALARAAPPR